MHRCSSNCKIKKTLLFSFPPNGNNSFQIIPCSKQSVITFKLMSSHKYVQFSIVITIVSIRISFIIISIFYENFQTFSGSKYIGNACWFSIILKYYLFIIKCHLLFNYLIHSGSIKLFDEILKARFITACVIIPG